MLRKMWMAVLTVVSLAGGVPAMAQEAAGGPGSGLYAALGEQAGIRRVVDDFVARLVSSPRLGPHFKDTQLDALRASLVDQLCEVSGGPCKYKGADMKSVHADMDINKGDFNALVELLQAAMDQQGVPFTQQNRLLARLAPMHRDVITVR